MLKLITRFLAGLTPMLAAALAAEGDFDALRVSAGKNGFTVGNQLIDVSLLSKVIACEPPWQEMRFYTMTTPLEIEREGSVTKLVQRDGSGAVVCREYSMATDGNSGVVRLEIELTEDLPTFLEYTIFTLPDYLLDDAGFTAVTSDGSVVSGRTEKPTTTEITYLAKDAVEFRAEGHYGIFRFKVLEGQPFTIADRRTVPFEFRKCFWIGSQGDMTRGETVKSVVEFSFEFPADFRLAAVEPSTPDAVVPDAPVSVRRDRRPLPPETRPAPKRLALGDRTRSVELASRITFEGSPFTADDRERLQKAADRLFGGEYEGLPLAVGKADGAPAHGDEEYTLVIDENGAKILAYSARGAFYGIQSMKNALVGGNRFRLLAMEDYPDMRLRGVHLAHVDKYSLKNYGDLIRNVMAPLKMNFLLLECEFAEWDATGGFHVRNAMPKEELSALLEIARDNFIETVPLVQTLGHTPWLFFGGNNLDLCEDPDYPYAFFTGNERLYPLLERLFDEVRETFGNPRYFHIGADEIFLFGKYPNRPETAEKGAASAVIDFVKWCHDYCEANNMQMMMWQDSFVTREESPENGAGGDPYFTADRRDDLPKDIIFTVWRYSGDYTEFGDLERLSDEGFHVVGASWYAPNNPENLTRAARKAGALGMISTTWIYTSDDQSARPSTMPNNNWFAPPDALFYYWFHQLAAYVRSAESSWNVPHEGDEPPAADSGEYFCALYDFAETAPAETDVWPLDVSPAANIVITQENNPFLNGGVYGIDSRFPELAINAALPFKAAERQGSPAALTVRSRNNPGFPESAVVNVGSIKAEKLHFLHTTCGAEPEKYAVVATVNVHYADGSTVPYPIRHLYEVGSPAAECNRYLSLKNRISTEGGNFWFSTWDNPFPEKEIAGIEVVAGNAPYYLFGISAEQSHNTER